MPTTTLATHSTRAAGGASELPPVVLLHGFAASGEEDFGATGWPGAFAMKNACMSSGAALSSRDDSCQ